MPSSKESRAIRQQLFAQQKGRCWWCGEECEWTPNLACLIPKANHFTIEHVKPRSEGGSKRDPGNAVGACYRCNQARNMLFNKLKAGKPVDDVMAGKKKATLKTILLASIQPYL
jgi:5-methylcytosine-specific restriction endonuclease McrA